MADRKASPGVAVVALEPSVSAAPPFKGVVAEDGVLCVAMSDAINENAGVVREYVGHGVGRQMHEDPQVPNYGNPDSGPLLKEGMVIAIEPMVNVGDWPTKRDSDNWTVQTLDGSLSAHFEHTIAIRDGEAEVLTLP